MDLGTGSLFERCSRTDLGGALFNYSAKGNVPLLARVLFNQLFVRPCRITESRLHARQRLWKTAGRRDNICTSCAIGTTAINRVSSGHGSGEVSTGRNCRNESRDSSEPRSRFVERRLIADASEFEPRETRIFEDFISLAIIALSDWEKFLLISNSRFRKILNLTHSFLSFHLTSVSF